MKNLNMNILSEDWILFCIKRGEEEEDDLKCQQMTSDYSVS